MIGPISQVSPLLWTGMIALVRGVIAASMRLGSMLNVPGSMSMKTGVAPTSSMTSPTEMKLLGTVITSSPGPMPAARNATCIAAQPELTADRRASSPM